MSDQYEDYLTERLKLLDEQQPFFKKVDDQILRFQEKTGMRLTRYIKDDVVRVFTYSKEEKDLFQIEITPDPSLKFPSNHPLEFEIAVYPVDQPEKEKPKWVSKPDEVYFSLLKAYEFILFGVVNS